MFRVIQLAIKFESEGKKVAESGKRIELIICTTFKSTYLSDIQVSCVCNGNAGRNNDNIYGREILEPV